LGLRTDQALGDLMEVVASYFYRRVRDLILEGLMRIVRKLKKLMDDRIARASDGRQEEERKRTHGETLRRAL
jgi:IS4 transposase